MRGYVGRPNETAAALDDDGWLHTGDLCRRDGSGALSFVGRRSEMINRGGEKVSPGEVEAVIGAHPVSCGSRSRACPMSGWGSGSPRSWSSARSGRVPDAA